MLNASLSYEILMYLNSFYFGMFAISEISIGVLKAINLQYSENVLLGESCILVMLCIMETARIILGRKCSLSDRGWQAITSAALTFPCMLCVIFLLGFQTNENTQGGWHVIVSVFLTIPCFMGVSYILVLQAYKLRLEYLMCTLMLALYLTEVWYAIMYVFSLCRPVTYD